MTESRITSTSSGEVVIAPEGRLDATSAPVLREQLLTQVQKGNVRLVVDLSGVDLIDSAGLSALVSGLKAARRAGGTLQIARPSKQVRSILKLTTLHRVLEHYESTDDRPSD